MSKVVEPREARRLAANALIRLLGEWQDAAVPGSMARQAHLAALSAEAAARLKLSSATVRHIWLACQAMALSEVSFEGPGISSAADWLSKWSDACGPEVQDAMAKAASGHWESPLAAFQNVALHLEPIGLSARRQADEVISASQSWLASGALPDRPALAEAIRAAALVVQPVRLDP